MKLAFVNQPFGTIQLPRGGVPLRSGSVGIWIYHVGRRCARDAEVIAYTRSADPRKGEVTICDGVEFRAVAVGRDERALALRRRGRALAGKLLAGRDPRRADFLSPAYYRGFIHAVASDLARRAPDVVYLNNFSQFAPVVRAENPRARIVLHMHCDWLAQLHAGSVEENLGACDEIACNSRYVADRVARRFPRHASKCVVLDNGADLELFSPGPPPADGHEVVFVGRLSPEKGVHVLVEAFDRVLRSEPEARLTLIGGVHPAPREFIVDIDDDPLVVGLARFYESPVPYAEALRALLTERTRERVRFVPDLPQEELRDTYRGAALLAFPSLWNEPFGMPLVEALACATPVVSTRGGGIPEIVSHGDNGLLAARGSVAELADSIAALLASPSQRREMGERGRRSVESRFSWDRVAETVLERARG